jgi:uncharacterized protein with ParB-like and HNH nuclease domain
VEQIITDIKSELLSIDDIIKTNHQYNIPRYQRLFVWQNEQVNTLLEDLHEAFLAEKSLFYLGGILIFKNKKEESVFDLIDGQQRFTTLWLLSIELGNDLTPFTHIEKQLRLKFSIRKEAKEYFENALKNETVIDELQISSTNTSLHRIVNTRTLIRKFIEQKLKNDKTQKKLFASFIREKVKLIVSEVPQGTDLNKLFEVINNRGVQLQHHEILKAKILYFIQSNKQERVRYGKIWNACANMEKYVEQSMRMEAGFYNSDIAQFFNKWDDTFNLSEMLNWMKGNYEKSGKKMDLNSILEGKKIEQEEGEEDYEEDLDFHPEAEDDETDEIRSILTFPQLLLHTLRIYLFQKGKKDINRINEKELLLTFVNYFKAESEAEAIEFIRLLWNVRFCFDLYVIKWVTTEPGEEIHLIKKLTKYNQYKKQTHYLKRQKPESNEGFALLQSMLYHSQQIITHYWLTPLLNKALTCRDKNELYDYLIQLDNYLFCTNDQSNLLERTWKIMKKELTGEDLNPDYDLLDNQQGVEFPHYWFYKLEFVLWYLLKNEKDEHWKDFRMTAKNSVEHISPQKPRYYDRYKVSQDRLNDFGNLVLVSRSINSEAGNNIYTTKRSEFLAKPKPDSLKSSLIYENPIWSDKLCDEHREKMKLYLERYFKETIL